jgi:hypothetical protein
VKMAATGLCHSDKRLQTGDIPHFAELYKVWEIIRSAGGLDVAMKMARISDNAMSRFTRTANHQAASGDNAQLA